MKTNIILLAVMIAGVCLAQQSKTDLSVRDVRDPLRLRDYLNSANTVVGTGVQATAVADEYNSYVNKTVINLADTPVSVIYGGGSTNAIGSVKLYDFPQGRINIVGVYVDGFEITDFPTNTMDVADGGDFSLGTAPPGADGVLDGTAVDLCPSTSVDPITNIVSSALASSAQFDGTSTAKELYLNVSIDHGDLTGTSTNELTVAGTIIINWLNLSE